MGIEGDHSARMIVLESDGIRFPDICPVCGCPTNTMGTIVSAVTKLGMRRVGQYYYSREAAMLPKQVRHLQIPTCEKHYYSATDMGRLRSVSGVCTGISTVCSGFLVLFIVFNLLDRSVLDVRWFLLLLGVGVFMLLGFESLRPSVLERHVSIVNLDLGTQALVLKIRHPWYADELLMLNPGTARAVRLRKRTT